MGQHVSRREQAVVAALHLEREGLTGLVQCEGCPDTNLVPATEGVCARHRPAPHSVDVYDNTDEGFGGYHSDAAW